MLKTFLINIVVWSILLPVVTLFAVYRKIVDVILRITHDESYGGLLKLNDAVFFWPDAAPIYLTTVLYIKSKSEIDLKSKVQHVIKKQVGQSSGIYKCNL